MKKCSSCGEWKSEEEFHWRARALGIRRGYCRACQAIMYREWYKKMLRLLQPPHHFVLQRQLLPLLKGSPHSRLAVSRRNTGELASTVGNPWHSQAKRMCLFFGATTDTSEFVKSHWQIRGWILAGQPIPGWKLTLFLSQVGTRSQGRAYSLVHLDPWPCGIMRERTSLKGRNQTL